MPRFGEIFIFILFSAFNGIMGFIFLFLDLELWVYPLMILKSGTLGDMRFLVVCGACESVKMVMVFWVRVFGSLALYKVLVFGV